MFSANPVACLGSSMSYGRHFLFCLDFLNRYTEGFSFWTSSSPASGACFQYDIRITQLSLIIELIVLSTYM